MSHDRAHNQYERNHCIRWRKLSSAQFLCIPDPINIFKIHQFWNPVREDHWKNYWVATKILDTLPERIQTRKPRWNNILHSLNYSKLVWYLSSVIWNQTRLVFHKFVRIYKITSDVPILTTKLHTTPHLILYSYHRFSTPVAIKFYKTFVETDQVIHLVRSTMKNI